MNWTTNLCSLRDAVDALVMSGAWRPAGLEFLDGARHGWTAADLARWLIGPYRDATSHVPRSAGDASTERDGCRSRVDVANVAAVLETARLEVVAALEDGGPGFVKAAIVDAAIVLTLDGLWIPLDKPRMLLKDRVLALFAADYLLQPQDYVEQLVVCSKCQAVVFDAAARQTGHCGAHRISDFVEVLGGPRRRLARPAQPHAS